MSAGSPGRKLAALVLLVAACDGEFHFDQTPPPLGAGAQADAPATGTGASTGNGSGGTDTDAGGALGTSGATNADGCAHCAEHGLVCEDDWHVCVECESDMDCSSPNPHCDPTLHRCTPCSLQNGCEPGSVCDAWSHSCLRSCATEVDPDHDCANSTHLCDTDRSVCVECETDDDCYGNCRGEHCAGGAHCAECASDKDCGQLRRFCDPLSFSCVECRDFRDCGPMFVCDPARHVCVGDE
jgi:hypothetical protein